MAKAELGTKRTCPNCGTRYYDLNRDPIQCPRCGAYFEGSVARSRAQAVAPDEEDETLEVETEGAEFVSLEEADAEASGGAEVPDEEEIELADDEDEDTFLEETDEEGEDVADIIGDVEDEEEP